MAAARHRGTGRLERHIEAESANGYLNAVDELMIQLNSLGKVNSAEKALKVAVGVHARELHPAPFSCRSLSARGGGAIPEAFVRALKRAGDEICLENTGHTHSRVMGVETAPGEQIIAGVVIN